MFRKLASVTPMPNSRLLAHFTDGRAVAYNVAALIESHPAFAPLSDPELFAQVKIDAGGYGVSWNDDIDLAANELYDHGAEANLVEAEKQRVVSEIAEARHAAGLTQTALAQASGVLQPIIGRLETGTTSPRLDTMLKLLAPLGKTLAVIDLEIPTSPEQS